MKVKWETESRVTVREMEVAGERGRGERQEKCSERGRQAGPR